MPDLALSDPTPYSTVSSPNINLGASNTNHNFRIGVTLRGSERLDCQMAEDPRQTRRKHKQGGWTINFRGLCGFETIDLFLI